ncbi:hypothetical protein BST61_g5458 [Cercospora zeina]
MASTSPPDVEPTTALSPPAAAPNTASDAAPPEYTGDAAMRVFAVTELLEHILLLAVTSQHDKAVAEKDMTLLKMCPMPGCGNVSKGGICLFSIQRVSKDFRYTIQGSMKLKQLIFLAPGEIAVLMAEEEWRSIRLPCHNEMANEESVRRFWLPLHRPLISMLLMLAPKAELGVLEFGVQCHRDIGGLMIDLGDSIFRADIAPHEIVTKKFPKSWHNPEASWRSVKMCNAKIPFPAKLDIDSSYWWHQNAKALPFAISFELDMDATLERVFDCFSELLLAVEDLEKASDELKEAEEAELEFSIGTYELIKKYNDKRDEQADEYTKMLDARLKAVAKYGKSAQAS